MTNVNIENIDITAFRKWQQAGNRAVEVRLGEAGDKDLFKIWVYDYDLAAGQYVQSVEEINLKEVVIDRANIELQKLGRLGAYVPLVEGGELRTNVQ